MSDNPYIKGFLEIEEARKKSGNVFTEAKKLTAAQKRHLDKNNNDKIDAEDFEMLRNEEAPATSSRPTPRPTRPGARKIVPAAPGMGGIYGPRADTTTLRGITAASRGPEAVERDERGLRVDLQPTPPTTSTTPTPAPTPEIDDSEEQEQMRRDAFLPPGVDPVVVVPTTDNTDGAAPRSLRGASGPGERGSTIPGITPEGDPVDRAAQTGLPIMGTPAADAMRAAAAAARDSDDSAAAATPEPPSRPTTTPERIQDVGTTSTNLRVGSSGDDVRDVQSFLGISADGQYGPQTRQAVMDFQRAQGLQVDGIIGDQTMSAIRRQQTMRGRSASGGRPANESVEFSAKELEHIASILETELTAEGLTIIDMGQGSTNSQNSQYSANSVSQGSTNSQNSQDRRGRERRDSQVRREVRRGSIER